MRSNSSDQLEKFYQEILSGEYLDLEIHYQNSIATLDKSFAEEYFLRGREIPFELEDEAFSGIPDLINSFLFLQIPIPPEVILAMNECFQNYFKEKGRLQLEEVFWGKPERGGGVFAKRLTTLQPYILFEKTKRAINKLYDSISEENLSERLLRNEDGSYDRDPDSFLRSYRNYNKRK